MPEQPHRSAANGVVGVIHAAALSIHAIGHALAQAAGLDSKHAVKQVDRLLSNGGFDVWRLFQYWVPFAIAARDETVVALDWTEFDKDDQSSIALYLITGHGRATPLLWKTVRKSTLGGNRNRYEEVDHASFGTRRSRAIVRPSVPSSACAQPT